MIPFIRKAMIGKSVSIIHKLSNYRGNQVTHPFRFRKALSYLINLMSLKMLGFQSSSEILQCTNSYTIWPKVLRCDSFAIKRYGKIGTPNPQVCFYQVHNNKKYYKFYHLPTWKSLEIICQHGCDLLGMHTIFPSNLVISTRRAWKHFSAYLLQFLVITMKT